MRDCDLAHAGGGLIQRGRGLVEPELRVAMIQFADHLPLFDEIADVHRRGDDAAGNQRRDVAGFVGDEGAGLLEAGRDGAGNSLRGVTVTRLRPGRSGGRGRWLAEQPARKREAMKSARMTKSVHLLCPLVGWVPAGFRA